MRSRANIVPQAILLLALLASKASSQDGWRNILDTIKLTGGVILPPEAAAMDPAALRQRVEKGYVAILEGASPAAESFGIRPTGKQITIRSIVDLRDPMVHLIWQQAVDAPVFELPKDAIIFAKERWQGAPVMAGQAFGKGRVLWVATDPGPSGHERYPYIPHALHDLGVKPPVHSKRLWIFLDTSYRMRADVEYMAKQWRRNGIAALHIAAWHYFEPDIQRDEYLNRLIGAAHRNAIHVYAWLELPHVSERFWTGHPQWREKTATGADAHLDWRKLMNLRNRECAAAVRGGVEELLRRFDWDGVNLAELYFESLEGHRNASRFTPMNAEVRQEFQKLAGFDPSQLFLGGTEKHWEKNPAGLTQFLEYRAELARTIQHEWIGVIEEMRKELPHLDLVLTHVDNLLEPETRQRIGADAKKLLPLLDQFDFTFLIEDPATAWSLGPERYIKIAGQYAPLVKRPQRLGVDINVVERYQDVYPSKQQIGTEMLREVHLAASVFSRVALYFETSIRKTDWPLVGVAAAAVKSIQRAENRMAVDAISTVGLRWQGSVKVDGQPWPVQGDGFVWVPAGNHIVEPGEEPRFRLLELNAELKSAWINGGSLEFAYVSMARAFAVLNKPPKRLLVDGVAVEPKMWIFDDSWVLVLPRGQHIVSAVIE